MEIIRYIGEKITLVHVYVIVMLVVSLINVCVFYMVKARLAEADLVVCKEELHDAPANKDEVKEESKYADFLRRYYTR